jgi:hypothetical protein
MYSAQTERGLITWGIVLCLAGVLTVANGLWASHRAERFQARAIRTTARVVPSSNSRGALQFETEQGTVEVPAPRKSRYSPGTTLKILYDPDDPERWTLEPGYDPTLGLHLVGAAGVMLLAGPIFLAFGWVSRRRSGRPFWQ